MHCVHCTGSSNKFSNVFVLSFRTVVERFQMDVLSLT